MPFKLHAYDLGLITSLGRNNLSSKTEAFPGTTTSGQRSQSFLHSVAPFLVVPPIKPVTRKGSGIEEEATAQTGTVDPEGDGKDEGS
jgi:hypothetical protein